MKNSANVRVTDAGKNPPKDSLHTIRIFNDATGELEIEMPAAKGGILIAHAANDVLIGTDQMAFGSFDAIVLCALKIRPIIKQMMKEKPELAAAIEDGARMMEEAGIEWTL